MKLFSKLKELLNEKKDIVLLIIIIIILSVIKQLFMLNIPINAYIYAGEDDALMIELAENILNGNWLGTYSYHTLVKGPVCPLVLASCKIIGVSYIGFMTALYTFSCLIFMISIKKLIKNKYIFIIIYTILLFNPIMYSFDIIQRVYRNALIPSFALLIIGSFIGIYIRREDKIIKIIPWSIIGSISLSLFYYTREDSMWILPFLIFIITSICISLIVKKKKIDLELITKFVFIILPVILLLITGNIISNLNEKYYGIKTTNSINHSKFKDAIQAIYSVKPNENIEYVTVTREKVSRMAEVSETFRYIEPILSNIMTSFATMDRNPIDNEVEDGWFFWALRISVSQVGAVTPEAEEEIYSNIAAEINKAIEEGKLESQSIMPSPLMPPWRKGNTKKLFFSVIKSFKFISTYDIKLLNLEPTQYTENFYKFVKRFENISGNKVIFEENAKNDDEMLVSELENQDQYLNSIKGKVKILNMFSKIYIVIGVTVLFLGIISYIILTINVLKNVRKPLKIDEWIINSGILGSIFTLVVGVSYNNISSCYSISNLYLAGAYPLLLAWGMLNFVLVIPIVREKFRKKV